MPSKFSFAACSNLLPVTDQVFGVNDREPDVILAEEIGEHLLALDLGQFAKIALTPKKVEGIEHQAVLATCGEFGLQFGKVCAAFVDDHHLTVDNRLARNVERAGND